MLYLSRFTFPDKEMEFDFHLYQRRTCYDTFYPFGVLSGRGLVELTFEPVTILCGGNGSGKTTALNIIGERLGLQRDTLYNRSNFFERYTQLCDFELRGKLPKYSRVITSDDVFDYMLSLREVNEGVDRRREEIFEEYLENRRGPFQLKSLEDYEQLKKVNQARHMTQSRYARANLKANAPEQSNGESAFYYFSNKIGENGLYLLDEPENSLSPQRQLDLVKFMEDSARFFGCQFVIATHSPFVLSMRGAKIYDLSSEPARVCRWTELEHVRTYFDFFREHEGEF